MSAVIRMTRQGQSEFVSTQPSPARLNAQPDTFYQLLDAQGSPITEYAAHLQDNGDLWIDLPDTATRPDFVLNQYADYFPSPSNQHRSYFGNLTAVQNADAAPAAATKEAAGLSFGSLTWSAAAATAGILGAAWLVKRHKDDDNLIQNHQNNHNNNGQSGGENPNTTTPGTHSGSNPNDNSGSNPNDNSGSNPNDNSGSNPNDNSGSNPNDNPPPVPMEPSPPPYINLPAGYTKELLSNGSAADINAVTQAARNLNQYNPNAEDQKIVINDLNNLSKEVRIELSQMVANLLNDIRAQWGVGEIIVSEGALNFAQDVANEYTDNNKSIGTGNGHYVEGIQRAAAKHGLNADGNYYENMSGGHGTGPITLDQLKQQVYEGVVRMLFEDGEHNYAHAKSLLNVTKLGDQDLQPDYLGVDTSSVESGKFSIHFISTADSPVYIQDASKFDKTPVAPAHHPVPAAMTDTYAEQPVFVRSAEHDSDDSPTASSIWSDTLNERNIGPSFASFTRDGDTGGDGQDPLADFNDQHAKPPFHLSFSKVLDNTYGDHMIEGQFTPVPLADVPHYSSDAALQPPQYDVPSFDVL
ncbi:SEC10/PgrA surface exclusion domain-containing protein [Conchiformibius steedae]|uniref:SEC10/PgrA surface exclusion domain-containing protein n=1 Tax=Conchiformibius steedae TaxID=153493 RepID=A0A3P2ABL8_9NEIS|nr:SEC10/PgrA surface exclusion domain-containing protein [Conchiformibius steedae]RRD91023.1 SEC10/PgrA surface exclusion domain-containing protein [Conchiformibius steedae]